MTKYRWATSTSDRGHLEADVPKLLSHPFVHCGLAWSASFAVDEVTASRGFDLWRSSEIDGRPGASFGAHPDRRHRLDDLSPQPTVGLSKIAGNRSRVERVGGHAGSFETPAQLLGEQNVGELRPSVDASASVAMGGVEIVEVQPATDLVQDRGHVNYAGGSALPDPIQQQACQQERTEMIDGESRLYPIRGLGSISMGHPCLHC